LAAPVKGAGFSEEPRVASFIVSLDCEGKWGMADALKPYHHRFLVDRALAEVYDRLVALFARYDLPATFAYVMAFTLTPEQRREFAALSDRGESGDDPWLRHFWADQEAGRTQGWFQPHALDAVKEDGRHEIACHSFCHRPMGEESLSPELAATELAAAARVASMKSADPRTFIFPRNEVGHLPLLRDAGYIGYRERLSRGAGAAARLLRLTEEFNIWPRRQPAAPPRDDGMVAIPPGYFLNWRFGSRRRVPRAVTIARWKSLLDRTARHGGVAHLWLHPHNLVTGPETALSLEAVLAHAARLREQGRLKVQTQRAYCEEMRAA
jgi:peptidoglycan/xylan/chitin deacetylase (PgdA/CDA1 family)